MATPQITINRAPVLTLWAAVVAERLGYGRDAALTLGQAVAGLNAHLKAQRLGILEDATDHGQHGEPSAREPDERFLVTVLGGPVPAIRTAPGVRATRGDAGGTAELVRIPVLSNSSYAQPGPSAKKRPSTAGGFVLSHWRSRGLSKHAGTWRGDGPGGATDLPVGQDRRKDRPGRRAVRL